MSEKTKYIDVTCGACPVGHLRKLMPLVDDAIRVRRETEHSEVSAQNYEVYLNEYQELKDKWEHYHSLGRWRRFGYILRHGGKPGEPRPFFESPDDFQKEVNESSYGYSLGCVRLTSRGDAVDFKRTKSYDSASETAKRLYRTSLVCSGYIKLTSDDAMFLGEWADTADLLVELEDVQDIRGILDAVLS